MASLSLSLSLLIAQPRSAQRTPAADLLHAVSYVTEEGGRGVQSSRSSTGCVSLRGSRL